MNIASLLRPDLVQVAVAGALFLTLGLWSSAICIEGGTVLGSPYHFYSHCNEAEGGPGPVEFRLGALLVDLALWYLAAALIVAGGRLAWRRASPS